MFSNTLCSDTGLNDANRQGQAEADELAFRKSLATLYRWDGIDPPNMRAITEANAQAFLDSVAYGVGILKVAHDSNNFLQAHVKRNEFMKRMIDGIYYDTIPRETTAAVKPELLVQRVRDW